VRLLPIPIASSRSRVAASKLGLPTRSLRRLHAYKGVYEGKETRCHYWHKKGNDDLDQKQ